MPACCSFYCFMLQGELQKLTEDNEALFEDNQQLRAELEGVRGRLNESRHSAGEAAKLAALSTADANLAR